VILQPLETTTAGLVIATLQGARTRCISPALALHQAGLLMTEDLANRIRFEVLNSAAARIESTRIRNLHERKLIARDPTPANLVKVIAGEVEMWADLARKGEFR
jgi:hypothetical protein